MITLAFLLYLKSRMTSVYRMIFVLIILTKLQMCINDKFIIDPIL